MTSYAVADIFRPKTMPSYTYINRAAGSDGATYEAKLRRALSSPGTLVSITGASKTGKTVLYRKVIEQDRVVSISGAQIQRPEDFWSQIAEKLDIPDEWAASQSSQHEASRKGAAQAESSVLSFLSAGLSGEIQTGQAQGQSLSRKVTRNNSFIMKTLIDGHFVLTIDDFHYIDPEVQRYIARILKAELFDGLSAILLSLPHRADDAIKRNPDLIGRTAFIELAAWSVEELKAIAEKGFALLSLDIRADDLEALAMESALSPQLMQENCLNLALRMQEAGRDVSSGALVQQAFRDTAENYQHYNDTIQSVLEGPARGRARRRQYPLRDGTTGDIYRLLLLSISASPPVLRLSLEEIRERMLRLLAGNVAPPNRLNLSNIMNHMEHILRASIPELDTVDWKGNTLYILDPFLLFYLRWGGDWQTMR